MCYKAPEVVHNSGKARKMNAQGAAHPRPPCFRSGSQSSSTYVSCQSAPLLCWPPEPEMGWGWRQKLLKSGAATEEDPQPQARTLPSSRPISFGLDATLRMSAPPPHVDHHSLVRRWGRVELEAHLFTAVQDGSKVWGQKVDGIDGHRSRGRHLLGCLARKIETLVFRTRQVF
jgi:hypothetical protein